MDEIRKYYAKCKEASHKIPHITSFHVHETSRIGPSIETESTLVAARGWSEGRIGSDSLDTGFPLG